MVARLGAWRGSIPRTGAKCAGVDVCLGFVLIFNIVGYVSFKNRKS